MAARRPLGAHALSIAIHALARDFGRQGHVDLRAQLTRAAHSIAGTIVEGRGAATHEEFGRDLDMAIESANETGYRLLTSHDHGLIADVDWQKHTAEMIEVRTTIHAYRLAVLRDEGGLGKV